MRGARRVPGKRLLDHRDRGGAIQQQGGARCLQGGRPGCDRTLYSNVLNVLKCFSSRRGGAARRAPRNGLAAAAPADQRGLRAQGRLAGRRRSGSLCGRLVGARRPRGWRLSRAAGPSPWAGGRRAGGDGQRATARGLQAPIRGVTAHRTDAGVMSHVRAWHAPLRRFCGTGGGPPLPAQRRRHGQGRFEGAQPAGLSRWTPPNGRSRLRRRRHPIFDLLPQARRSLGFDTHPHPSRENLNI